MLLQCPEIQRCIIVITIQVTVDSWWMSLNQQSGTSSEWGGRIYSATPRQAACNRGIAAQDAIYVDRCRQYFGIESATSSPEARAMHTGTFGKFVSGRDSILVYGGLSDTGQALQDFWYYDLVTTNLKFGHNFLFRLGTIPDPSRWTSAELTAAYSDLKVILAKYIKIATTDPESLQVCRDYEENCDKDCWDDRVEFLITLDIYDLSYIDASAPYCVSGMGPGLPDPYCVHDVWRFSIFDDEFVDMYDCLFFAVETQKAQSWWQQALTASASSLQSSFLSNSTICASDEEALSEWLGASGGRWWANPGPTGLPQSCIGRQQGMPGLNDIRIKTAQYNDLPTCDATLAGVKFMRCTNTSSYMHMHACMHATHLYITSVR